MRTKIAESNVGKRMIAGTEWPVVNQVHRWQRGRQVRWVATFGLCNGVPSGARVFRSRAKALEAIQ